MNLAIAAFRRFPPPVKKVVKKAVGAFWLRKRIAYQSTFKCLAEDESRPVSIVIPSYNDFEYLKKCLRGIASTCSEQVKEILIVDDFCEAENASKLMTLETDIVRVILKDTRLGFAGTVNVGIHEAQHDVVLLNSDTVPLQGWLCNLQKAAYGSDPSIGIVSPMLVYPSGLIQYGGTFHASSIAPQWFAHLYGGQNPLIPEANLPFYIRGASGACMYIKREVLKKIPGLDDQYWLGFEDVDYAYQAWAQGFRSYYEPSSALIHHESASRGYSQGVRELSSLRRFWSKWGNPIGSDLEVPITELSFIYSSEISDLWLKYLAAITGAMQQVYPNIDIQLRKVQAPDFEEVAEFQGVAKRVIVCDWGAATFGWLASVSFEKSVLYCESFSPEQISHDVNIDHGSKGFYRPEFIYLPASSQDKEIIDSLTPWVPLSPVIPGFPFSRGNTQQNNDVLLISQSIDLTAAEDEIIQHLSKRNLSTVVIALPDLGSQSPDGAWPAITIVSAPILNSVEASFLASRCSIPIVGSHSYPSKILLDGFNCRTFNEVDAEKILEEVDVFLGNPEISTQYLKNLELTSESLFKAAAESLMHTSLQRGVRV